MAKQILLGKFTVDVKFLYFCAIYVHFLNNFLKVPYLVCVNQQTECISVTLYFYRPQNCGGEV